MTVCADGVGACHECPWQDSVLSIVDAKETLQIGIFSLQAYSFYQRQIWKVPSSQPRQCHGMNVFTFLVKRAACLYKVISTHLSRVSPQKTA